jgi:excisionase family DNA binding protein
MNNYKGIYNSKMLRPKDIAKILDCSIDKAYRIINQKGFPKMMIGKRYYISQDEFEKWVKKSFN